METLSEFFSALTETARATPSALASVSRFGILHYPAFCQNIESIGRHAHSLGVRPGNLVLVTTDHADARMQVILGLLKMGCRVGVSQAIQVFRAGGLAADFLITDDPKPPPGYRVLALNAQWFRPQPAVPSRPVAETGSLIFGSSGSTGRTKLIEVAAGTFLQRVALKLSRPYHQTGARYLVAYGESTSAAWVEALATLTRGGTIFRPTDRSAPSLLDAISLYQPTYAAIPPATVVDLLRILKERPAPIRKFDCIIVSGGMCSAETLRLASEVLADRVMTEFGTTEISTICTGDVVLDPSPESGMFVGKLEPDVEVLVLDEAGRPLPPGEPGRLRIRATSKRVGRYVGASTDASAFEDDWFDPGDVGRVDADRNFFVVGRANTIINIGGTKLNPDDYERAVAGHANIRELAVVGVTGPNGYQQVHAAVVSRDPVDLDYLNRYLRQKSPRLVVHAVRRIDKIPRTDIGKVDRAKLREILAS